jgi:hypothetical protein
LPACYPDKGLCREEIDLRVGRQPDVLHLNALIEKLPNLVSADAEGNVADEESIALGAHNIVELLGPVLAATTVITGGSATIVVASRGDIKLDGSAVNLLALHSVQSLLSGLGVGKVNEAKATAAAGFLLGNYASTSKALALLELFKEPLIIDVPAELAGPNSRTLGGLLGLTVGLGLLGGGVIGLVELSLFGRPFSLGLRGVLRFRLGAVGVRVGRVRRLEGLLEDPIRHSLIR